LTEFLTARPATTKAAGRSVANAFDPAKSKEQY